MMYVSPLASLECQYRDHLWLWLLLLTLCNVLTLIVAIRMLLNFLLLLMFAVIDLSSCTWCCWGRRQICNVLTLIVAIRMLLNFLLLLMFAVIDLSSCTWCCWGRRQTVTASCRDSSQVWNKTDRAHHVKVSLHGTPMEFSKYQRKLLSENKGLFVWFAAHFNRHVQIKTNSDMKIIFFCECLTNHHW